MFVNLTAADGSVCQRLPASIVSKDASHELVVLQIVPPAGGLRPVVLASSSAVRVGQDAYLLAALPDGSPSIAAGKPCAASYAQLSTHPATALS